MNARHRRIALGLLLIIFLVLLGALGRFLWHRHLYAVTNAVFVETDSLVLLSFDKVNGRLRKLNKAEGEKVIQGEVLAELDKEAYLLRVQNLKEVLVSLKAKAEALRIALKRLRREIALEEARVGHEAERLRAERKALAKEKAALEAELFQAERDLERFRRLLQKELVPPHRVEELATKVQGLRERRKALEARMEALTAALKALHKTRAKVINQRKLLREKEQELRALEAQIRAQKKALEEAQLLLTYCSLRSPIEGYIAKRFHSVGDVVGPGEPVYALVDYNRLYILVLLEETKLRGVKPGCEARIKIDAYPGKEFRGVVTAVLPATAAKFALVPRDISAGEFTKVAQRVPIKIKITEGDLRLLKVGLGGEVEIRRKF